MKQRQILLACTVLALVSLACNALAGRRNSSRDVAPDSTEPAVVDQLEPTAEPPADSNNSGSNDVVVNTDFPMTDDAFNVTDIGDGSILYYTKLSQDEVLKFYRDEYAPMGYTEREILTSITEGVFSIVFDGDPSGKAVVIQSVDLGDSRTVAIRLEAIP